MLRRREGVGGGEDCVGKEGKKIEWVRGFVERLKLVGGDVRRWVGGVEAQALSQCDCVVHTQDPC